MTNNQEVLLTIESQDYALVFQTNPARHLKHIYFGKKLAHAGDYSAIKAQLKYDHFNGVDEDHFNSVYTPSGTWNTANTALELKHHDGNESTELEYVKHSTKEIEKDVVLTTIELVDPLYGTVVNLYLKVYQAFNVFEQWTSILNKEPDTVQMKKYASANLYFRNREFHLTQFHGTWAREMNDHTQVLSYGTKVLETKLGTRANLYNPPSFQLSFDGPATEDTGKVMLANLAWSGNFRFEFEIERYGNLRLIAGINPYASNYALKAGEEFETPHLIYTYSETGIATATIQMHRWARQHRIWNGHGERLTLLNNWEATYFDFDEDKLVDLFKGAKEIGVDCFLLDDGWFANKYPRNDDTTGLGDWEVNKTKLPNGIPFLVKAAKAEGVKFGIWIEPEMVNPKSALYENHLDWVIRQPERPEVYFRNQLVLDLSNPEVQDYVFSIFNNLLTENPEIAYVKWDCNAVIYNAYSAYLEREGIPQSHLYVAYVKGLYEVLKRVRAGHPKVPIMLCSGGGGRVDYGALQYYTEFWPSDNTSPIDRVFMHWNYSKLYPANTLCAHVTDWDKTASLKFRTDVACMGKLGFDIDVSKLTTAEKSFCQIALKDYNRYKHTVWNGDVYRIQHPDELHFASFLFVDPSQKQAVLFAYMVTNRFEINYSFEPVKLKGLDPMKKYQVKELNIFPETETALDESVILSGDLLMKAGFNPQVSSERKSVVVLISEAD